MQQKYEHNGTLLTKQHNEILKYCAAEKFRVVLYATARYYQRGPMTRKYKIFCLILIYIDMDFYLIFQTLSKKSEPHIR